MRKIERNNLSYVCILSFCFPITLGAMLSSVNIYSFLSIFRLNLMNKQLGSAMYPILNDFGTFRQDLTYIDGIWLYTSLH